VNAKWYVGVKASCARIPFRSEFPPTFKTHGMRYVSVIGPFRTRRGAMLGAAVGGNNPHIKHVSDAERIAKLASCRALRQSVS
jgi:hypothetical protein